MKLRISPAWWPAMALTSPIIVPWLFKRNRLFNANKLKARDVNRERIESAQALDLPELEYLNLTVLVEWHAKDGFIGDAGVSYLFETNLGSLLFDVGFGPERPAFAHNAGRLDFHFDNVDALVISHLHPDHMGGLKATKQKTVMVPQPFIPSRPIPCYLPDKAEAPGFTPEIITTPALLPAGMATTGPLARSLFMFGYIEEQALLANIKNKGLVIFTGCGHPGMDVILNLAAKLSPENVHCIGGGLHFPVTDGRGNRIGIKFQTIIGTGKPPWQKISNADLDETISRINKTLPEQVYLSGHDTCDTSIERLKRNLKSKTGVLKSGETFTF